MISISTLLTRLAALLASLVAALGGLLWNGPTPDDGVPPAVDSPAVHDLPTPQDSPTPAATALPPAHDLPTAPEATTAPDATTARDLLLPQSTFVVTAGADANGPLPWVQGLTVQVRPGEGDGQLVVYVDTPCNDLTVNADAADGRLNARGGFQTLKGCVAAATAQEAWLSEFWSQTIDVAADRAGDVRLTRGSASLTLRAA
ncbi:MAG: hypothetical protein LBS56_04995 [Propionibacteriaceae bacterium]|jgi:hypothetical protein|nr:hypothetical protein [Propionibacteriaceae bacterium]